LKLLLKFPADFQAMLLLFIWQQSWHKLRHNPPHSQFLRQNSSVDVRPFLKVYVSRKFVFDLNSCHQKLASTFGAFQERFSQV
jgi:hypothetical protein